MAERVTMDHMAKAATMLTATSDADDIPRAMLADIVLDVLADPLPGVMALAAVARTAIEIQSTIIDRLFASENFTAVALMAVQRGTPLKLADIGVDLELVMSTVARDIASRQT